MSTDLPGQSWLHTTAVVFGAFRLVIESLAVEGDLLQRHIRIELAAVILVIWGVVNEKKLIDFEDRFFQKIKSFFKN